MARFGYLFLRKGRWGDPRNRLRKWMQMARTPGPANANYGFAKLVSEHWQEAAAGGA